MDDYSLARKIWRIIYPVLIFVGVQLVISFAIELSMSLALIVKELLTQGTSLDMSYFVDTVTQFIYDNSMLIVLISNIVSFAVFLPIWLTMRKRAEQYENRNPAGISAAVVGFFAGFNIVQLLVFGLVDITRFFPAYEELAELLTGGSIIMQILSVGIAAPVVEELVFRGILMNRMKWLPVWASVLIQAFLFSVVHFNLFQSLYAFLAGALLGLVYIKYRSIIMVIAGHISFNLISVVLSEYLPERLAVFVFLLCPLVMAGCGIILVKHPGAVKKGTVPEQFAPIPWNTGY